MCRTPEWIFHFNRIAREGHNTVECSTAGQVYSQTKVTRRKDGTNATMKAGVVNTHRAQDSVIRVNRASLPIDHPAYFPVQVTSDTYGCLYESRRTVL